MVKKPRTIEEELRKVQYLLVGILLKKEPTVKELSKIMGVSDNAITKLFPEKKKRKKIK